MTFYFTYTHHPLFGTIVPLNRYRWPEEEDTEIDNNELRIEGMNL